MAAEAKNPRQNLPLAVFGTILIVTTLYSFAALALVGMQDYRKIDSDSGFSFAFLSNGWVGAAQVVAIGEIVTLPLGVLVSVLAQPRLQFALARDGLLPKVFARLDAKGNLSYSIMFSGIGSTLVALFVPFTSLNDVISAGVLISFIMTNVSLLVRFKI